MYDAESGPAIGAIRGSRLNLIPLLAQWLGISQRISIAYHHKLYRVHVEHQRFVDAWLSFLFRFSCLGLHDMLIFDTYEESRPTAYAHD